MVDAHDVRSCLEDSYRDCPFVRICADDRLPSTRNVRGTNFIDIGVRCDAESNTVILISAIDNLVKGAAGQAVQNLNLMLGFPEDEGL